MIRRLVAVATLTTALFVVTAGPAGADNGNILCVYAKEPKPGVGLCIGLPKT